MASQDQALAARPAFSVGALATAAAWAVICLLALGFIGKYVVHYVLNYGPRELDVFWPRRWGFLAHIAGGTVALGLGPLQFWTGLKARLPRVHRWVGRSYLFAVGVGSVGAFYLAATNTVGWHYGFALAMLGVAWSGCAGVAYAAILNGAVALHRRWMVRAYVVTFAFVIYRLIADVLPTSQLKPAQDLAVADAWVCWVIPLMITVGIQAVGDIRRHGRRRPRGVEA